MTRDEYIEELHGLIDSFDEHVTPADAAFVLESTATTLRQQSDWDQE